MLSCIILPTDVNAEISGVTIQKYIMVDQFGYRPGDDKVAVLVDPQVGFNAADSYLPGNILQVRRVSDDAIVFTGSPVVWNNGITQPSSGDRGWWFDFSSVTAEGDYYIYDVQNNCKSYNFRIAEDVYKDILKAAIRTFYYQRIGTPHLAQHAGAEFADDAAFVGPHQDTEARNVFDKNNPATAKDLSGGWMDAGDFNKYVTFTAQPINELLTAYEEKPEIFTDDYNIPESGNGIPDIIDEIKWELDWLKKMQQSDGGVLLKVGFARSGGGGSHSLPPSTNTAYRYYLPACSSSTIITALNFAHAALTFSRFPRLQSYASDLKDRAILAWDWYHANPKNDNLDQGEIEAGDADMSLEGQAQTATIAAVYLYALTGDEKYHTYFKNNYTTTFPMQDDYWGMYYGEQADALMYYTTLPNADPTVKAAILARRDNNDADYSFIGNQDLYRSYVPDWAYHWGSLQVRARFAASIYDFVQYDINNSKRDNYYKRAQNILHYFHGVNPFGHVYLTNMGDYGAENSITQIFHSWFSDGTQWDYAPPGYLPGGPSTQYSGTTSPPRGQPYQKMYRDWNGIAWEWPNNVDASWEITENAIYYQAAYIKMLTKFIPVPPAPTEPPATPSGISAISPDTGSIVVSWNSVPGASGYDIEVDGTVVDNGPATSYTHSGLQPGTSHSYRVRAKNIIGTSEWSNTITATTQVPPDPPGVPENVTASATDSYNILVEWDESAGATGYDIEVDGTVIENILGTEYTHSGVDPGSTHYYRVRAKNSGGFSNWSGTVSAVTPEAPETSVHDLSHNGTYGYTFGQSSDQIKRYQTFIADYYPNITGVEVKIRKNVSPGNLTAELYAVSNNLPTGTPLASAVVPAASVPSDYAVVSIPLTYSGLIRGSEYAIVLGQSTPGVGGTYEWLAGVNISDDYNFGKYTGSWVDESGISEGWMKVYVSSGSQQQPPATPTGLTALATGTSSIEVSWNAVSGATEYELEIDGSPTYVSTTETSYVHTGLTAGSTHYYRVRAKNSSGVSAWSNPAEATTRVPAATVIDISHDGTSGYTFGQTSDQIKRWQTFIANSNTRIVNVEVKVRKFNTASNITVSLYATSNNRPAGNALATAEIPANLVGGSFTVVSAPLNYTGLVEGTEYAIVLGQVINSNYANYEWCTSPVSSDLQFGKYNGSSWVDESGIGDGWLKVYVEP